MKGNNSLTKQKADTSLRAPSTSLRVNSGEAISTLGIASGTSRPRNDKLILSFFFAIIFALYTSISYAQDEDEGWELRKGKHFLIYYKEGVSRDYTGSVERKAESYYKSILNYLGFNRFDFWTWDNRCKIYLYPGQEEYLEDTNVEKWSNGRVHVTKKEIITYSTREEFLDYVLPHEMGHIIFREAIGVDRHMPLWIDEAVATLQEKDRERYLQAAKAIVENDDYVSLRRLSEINTYTEIPPVIFYSQAASVVDFLLERYGRRRFAEFCRDIKNGDDWQSALFKTYKFEDLDDLEREWIESLTS